MAPLETRSAPTSAKRRTVSSVMPPDSSTSGRRTPGRGGVLVGQRRRSGGPRRAPCCRAARRRRPPRAPPGACRRCRTRRGRACPGRPARASATASATPSTVRWLSLNITHSERFPRWLAAPPARTAAFSSARSPGVVLRVSQTRIVGSGRLDEAMGERGDARQVAEEVEGRALGGQHRCERARDGAEHLTGRDRVAVGGLPAARRSPGRPGRTPRWRSRCRPAPRRPG